MVKIKKLTSQTCTCVTHGIFSELETKAKELVSMYKVMNQYKKGQTLFTEGAPNFGLYCINSGKIKVTKAASEERETILRIVGPGDVIGHQNILTNDKNQNSATMIEDGSVCFIDRKFITELIHKEPSITINLIKKLSAEMTASENRHAAMSNKNVKERLAELLITFKTNYGIKEANRVRLDIKLTREEMASIVGTANETVIRFISEFKDEGILEQEGKTIFLLDERKLIQSANVSV